MSQTRRAFDETTRAVKANREELKKTNKGIAAIYDDHLKNESTNRADFEASGNLTEMEGVSYDELNDVVEESDESSLPNPISRDPPIYPEKLRNNRVEGLVIVKFIVDEDGNVVDPKIESSTHTGFNQSAIDAIEKWKFTPGISKGQVVKTTMRIPFRFDLK